MQRVLVGGISGAGKSTMARALAKRFDLPYVEIDALHHGPGWTTRPEFVSDVERLAEGERWVLDSDGTSVAADLLWSRADTLVWLDLPRWQVMLRVLRRSIWRGVRHAELWNGNRESFLQWLDAGHPVRWAFTKHADRRATIGGRLEDAQWAELQVVHLRSAAQARRWRRAVCGQAS